MPNRLHEGRFQGRLRAVLSCAVPVALLAGCASGGTTPLSASLAELFPDDQATARQATEIPHASLSVQLGDVSGLMVMGSQAGEMTYWPSGEGVVLELRDGGLHATSGLDANLLGTHYTGPPPWRREAPARVEMKRHWRDADGHVVQGTGEGQLRCDATEMLALPLAERELERCSLVLEWADGSTTDSTLWRDPSSHRLWAVDETPWPGAPTMQWQVARHWW